MKASCNTWDLEYDYQFFVRTSWEEAIRAVSLFPGSEGPLYLVDFFLQNQNRIIFHETISILVKLFQVVWKLEYISYTK